MYVAVIVRQSLGDRGVGNFFDMGEGMGGECKWPCLLYDVYA